MEDKSFTILVKMLEQIQSQMNRLDHRFDRFEEKLDRFEEKLEKLERKVEVNRLTWSAKIVGWMTLVSTLGGGIIAALLLNWFRFA